MTTFLLTLLTGIVAGTIDILPMIRMKLDKFSTISAFVFYLIVPFIIFSTDLFGMPWWLKGSVVTFLFALPVIILVAKDGLQSALTMVVMSVVLGFLIGLVGHFVLKVM